MSTNRNTTEIVNDFSKSATERQMLLLYEISLELQKLNSTLELITGHDETCDYYNFICTKETRRTGD